MSSDQTTLARNSTTNDAQQAEQVDPSQVQASYRVPIDEGILLFRSSVFLVMWLVLFAAGLLCETSEQRYLLAPLSVETQLGKEEMRRLDRLLHEKAVGNLAKTKPESANAQVVPPEQSTAASTTESFPNAWRYRANTTLLTVSAALFICLFCYTPTNLAFLSFLAALIGGYASNLRSKRLSSKERKELGPTIVGYLQEPPMSAAIRGFVVYLCVIAGLYVVIDDPFKSPSSGQYLRLAGTISVLAFTVGYDPSRFNEWLKLVRSPGIAPAADPKPADPKPADPKPTVALAQSTPPSGAASQ